jgi:GxxExxY protein
VTEEQIGHDLIGAALKVHSAIGPGLLESAYETCLLYELEKQNLPARRQVLIPFRYDGLTIDNGYRIDHAGRRIRNRRGQGARRIPAVAGYGI